MTSLAQTRPPLSLPAAAPAHEHCVRTSLELLSELYNYNHWIYNKVRPFIRGRVCEVGSGVGNITQFMLNSPQLVGIEPCRTSCQDTASRFRQHQNVRLVHCALEECPNTDVPKDHFDTVVCLNVLEHIGDDVDSLRRMRSLCTKRGRVVILVPAHMSIYGQLDRSFGHWRRYNRRSLRQAFTAAGLAPTYSFYMNMLGYFGWCWQSRILKRDQISASAGWVFNRLVPFLDAFERLVRLPFGQSLVMIGTPANPA